MRRRGRRTGVVLLYCALLGLSLMLSAMSATALVLPPSAPVASREPAATATANAANDTTGAWLRLEFTETDTGVDVLVTAGGLVEGAGYRLYAVDAAKHRIPVANWTGDAGTAELAGELPLRIADLSSLVLNRSGRGTVITVAM